MSHICLGHPGIKISGSDPDLALNALLEYFDVLPDTLKVQNCYLVSYILFMQR